jgi:hypothetical protein
MVVSINTVLVSDGPDVASRLGLRSTVAGENAGALSQGPPSFTITRIDEYTVQVDFASSVLDLPTLRWPGAYAFDPPLEVLSVEPGPLTVASPYNHTLRVTLTTEEQGPFLYALTVFGLERL